MARLVEVIACKPFHEFQQRRIFDVLELNDTTDSERFNGSGNMVTTLVDYAKDNEQFQLRSAMLDGEVLDPAGISRLATLPSLDELRGRLIGLLQAPASQLARLLNEPGAQIARVVSARSEGGESKTEGGE